MTRATVAGRGVGVGDLMMLCEEDVTGVVTTLFLCDGEEVDRVSEADLHSLASIVIAEHDGRYAAVDCSLISGWDWASLH